MDCLHLTGFTAIPIIVAPSYHDRLLSFQKWKI